MPSLRKKCLRHMISDHKKCMPLPILHRRTTVILKQLVFEDHLFSLSTKFQVDYIVTTKFIFVTIKENY